MPKLRPLFKIESDVKLWDDKFGDYIGWACDIAFI